MRGLVSLPLALLAATSSLLIGSTIAAPADAAIVGTPLSLQDVYPVVKRSYDDPASVPYPLHERATAPESARAKAKRFIDYMSKRRLVASQKKSLARQLAASRGNVTLMNAALERFGFGGLDYITGTSMLPMRKYSQIYNMTQQYKRNFNANGTISAGNATAVAQKGLWPRDFLDVPATYNGAATARYTVTAPASRAGEQLGFNGTTADIFFDGVSTQAKQQDQGWAPYYTWTGPGQATSYNVQFFADIRNQTLVTLFFEGYLVQTRRDGTVGPRIPFKGAANVVQSGPLDPSAVTDSNGRPDVFKIASITGMGVGTLAIGGLVAWNVKKQKTLKEVREAKARLEAANQALREQQANPPPGIDPEVRRQIEDEYRDEIRRNDNRRETFENLRESIISDSKAVASSSSIDTFGQGVSDRSMSEFEEEGKNVIRETRAIKVQDFRASKVIDPSFKDQFAREASTAMSRSVSLHEAKQTKRERLKTDGILSKFSYDSVYKTGGARKNAFYSLMDTQCRKALVDGSIGYAVQGILKTDPFIKALQQSGALTSTDVVAMSREIAGNLYDKHLDTLAHMSYATQLYKSAQTSIETLGRLRTTQLKQDKERAKEKLNKLVSERSEARTALKEAKGSEKEAKIQTELEKIEKSYDAAVKVHEKAKSDLETHNEELANHNEQIRKEAKELAKLQKHEKKTEVIE